MTEKRFRVNDLVKYHYSEIGEYIDENHTDRPLMNNEVCELLNELHEENIILKKVIGEDDDLIRSFLSAYCNRKWEDFCKRYGADFDD